MRPAVPKQTLSLFWDEKPLGNLAIGQTACKSCSQGQFSSLVGQPSCLACPLGYVPSVRFSTENATAILESLYNCQILGRPGS